MSDLAELEACIAQMRSAVVAFSGGVDSSLVAAVAARVLGDRGLAGSAVAAAMLTHTSALGVRATPMRRYELERELRTVTIDGHAVRVKLGRLQGSIVNVAPEHDDCAAVARTEGVSVKSIWAAALAAGSELT